MTLTYTVKLGLKIQKTNINAQKINRFLLKTYGIVIVVFHLFDKLSQFRIFSKTFLLADISVEVALGMYFLTFSNANNQFAKKKLTWKTYTTKKTLFTP